MRALVQRVSEARVSVAGAVVGAIGVSGAPGGEADDACALAGLRAVADALADRYRRTFAAHLPPCNRR